MAGSKPIEPGCLVLIVGGFDGSPNIGKMGTAKFIVADGLVHGGRSFHPRAFGHWLVEGEGILCRLAGGARDGQWTPDGFCTSRPEHLLRIDPEADPLDVTHEEPLEFSHGR